MKYRLRTVLRQKSKGRSTSLRTDRRPSCPSWCGWVFAPSAVISGRLVGAGSERYSGHCALLARAYSAVE